MTKTCFEWQGETRYISDVTDKGGIVPEMNNDKAGCYRGRGKTLKTLILETLQASIIAVLFFGPLVIYFW